jgi:hypothetical protein
MSSAFPAIAAGMRLQGPDTTPMDVRVAYESMVPFCGCAQRPPAPADHCPPLAPNLILCNGARHDFVLSIKEDTCLAP